MKLSVVFVLFVLFVAAATAAERAKSLYKVSHVSETLVGISCPGNHSEPKVIGNYGNTLLISCGTN